MGACDSSAKLSQRISRLSKKNQVNSSLEKKSINRVKSLSKSLAVTKCSTFSSSSLVTVKINPSIFFFENPKKSIQSYIIKRKIGSGTFGTVFLCQKENENSLQSIKKLAKNTTTKQEFNLELSMLQNLSHPNIISLHDYCETQKAYYLTTTHCLTDLFPFLSNRITERQLAEITFQLLSVLSYFENKQILHRDLKLENIMIFAVEENPKYQDKIYYIKLIDFGTCLKGSQQEKVFIGSSYYVAPEIVYSNYYSSKCDIWSLGVVLYMLITGGSPFEGHNSDAVIEDAKNKKFTIHTNFFKGYSKELCTLLKKILEKDPNKRITAKEALTDIWFKNNVRLELFDPFCVDNEERSKKVYENIIGYTRYDKFEKIVFMYITRHYCYADNVLYMKLFLRINTSNDGMIKKEELSTELEKYYGDEIYIDDIFESLCCIEGNEYIEYIDFVTGSIDKGTIIKSDAILENVYNEITSNKECALYRQLFEKPLTLVEFKDRMRSSIEEMDS